MSFFNQRGQRVWKIGVVMLVVFALVFSDCDYTPYSQGQALYESQCANCHMENGQGLRNLIPPLAGADFLDKRSEEIACIIRYGIQGEIEVNGEIYNSEMAGIKILTDVQINNIINYINTAWGNNYGRSNVERVEQLLENCQ